MSEYDLVRWGREGSNPNADVPRRQRQIITRSRRVRDSEVSVLRKRGGGLMTNREMLEVTERGRQRRIENIAGLEESIRNLRRQIEEVDPVILHLRTLPPDLPLGEGAGVESPEFGRCAHPEHRRSSGPRVPLRYGSA